jgi:hypothetical protein
MATVPSPIAQPLGGATVSGTTITVDSYVNPPTKIPAIVRNLVASNRGYFAESVFSTPGMTVEGGAVIYEVTDPDDLFLPDDQSLAPRAPGAEAPILGARRGQPKVARPESWSGAIEVTDEARKRNNVIAIRNQFTRAANTLANNIQLTAISTLEAFISANSRTVESPIDWDAAAIIEKGVLNADPTKLPFADLALIEEKFVADKAGVLPDTVILNTYDWRTLQVIYAAIGAGNGGVRGLLSEFGLTPIVSVLAPKGAPIFLKAGQVGDMLFEKPLTQETHRVRGFKDVTELDVAPVLIAHDATAVWQLTKANE